MDANTQPLSPYDPTDEQIAVARRHLDDHAARFPEGIEYWVLGWVEAQLSGPEEWGTSAERAISNARAMFAAFKTRRAEAVES